MPTQLKDPSVRRRTNKATTKATLRVMHDVKAPPLPEGDWHPMACEFWSDVWASPMAPELVKADIHGLYVLVALVDRFWSPDHDDARSYKLAAEIRMQRQAYGLTPLDRSRLHWEIDRGDQAEENTTNRRATRRPSGKPSEDPRQLLATPSPNPSGVAPRTALRPPQGEGAG